MSLRANDIPLEVEMGDKEDVDVEAEALEALKARVARGLIHPLHLEDAECGFTYARQIDEVKALSDVSVRRLALMAVRFYDSPWSDKDRDLYRGVQEVLHRKSEMDSGEE